MKSKKIKKAFENLEFLNSSDGRVIRLLSEYLEPKRRLRKHRIRDTIVFFGSARSISMQEAVEKYENVLKKNKEEKNSSIVKYAKAQIRLAQYYQDARDLAFRLTEWSMSLKDNQRFIVCSGGGPGMMEAANRGAREAGGKTLGLNISLPHEQTPNPYISPELNFEFHYFFMRKFWFIYLAKALVIFPGGFGTMDELFEVLTLIQTKKLQKQMSVLIYGKEYWQDIINFEKFVEWGTITEEDYNLIHFADTVDEAYEHLTADLHSKFLQQRKFWYL